MTAFDLIVVGTGSSGTGAAMKCAQGGLRVAIVDERPFGGTCALRGCDPKKVLVGAAELADWARRMHEARVVSSPLEIDWAGLIRFKRTFTEPAPDLREREYARAGIAMFHGVAAFADKQALRVNGEILEARHIVVAAGAKPVPLQLPGEQLLKTSTDFLEFETLPKRIVFVGGGFIAFEFAHIAARAGAAATILEQETRPLRAFEADLVERLVRATRDLGIQVRLATKATAFEKHSGGITVHAQCGDKDESFECDAIVHGGGRVPDLDDLQLNVAGVERTQKGVKVNEFLQSVSNPAVYAAGDAADGHGPPLTPVAALEGEVVAENILKGNTRRADFSGLASAVYTTPPLAVVGLTEETARGERRTFDVHAGDMSDWYSSRRVAAKTAAYKILVERETGVAIGAHILGPDAEELANIFSLAIRAKVPVSVLKDALFAYPTAASDIAEML